MQYVSSIDPFSIVVYPTGHFTHVRSFQCCWNSPFAHLMQDSDVKNVPGGQSVIVIDNNENLQTKMTCT
jgi:hypothetical protein